MYTGASGAGVNTVEDRCTCKMSRGGNDIHHTGAFNLTSKRNIKPKASARAEAFTNVREVNFNTHTPRRPILTPKTEKQEEYIDLLTSPEKLIVFSVGPAGTGKTLLAVLAGIQALRDGKVKKIVITRPAVGVDDEDHGFLPGDINMKMAPWVKPIFDVILEYYNHRELAKMLEDEVIELSPLAFMRGRSFAKCWIIADEMQNSSVNQLLMLTTRIGAGSKMIITGDLNQVDNRFRTDNGLTDFFEKFKAYKGKSIGCVHMNRKDVQRHAVVSEILKLYNQD